MFLRVIICLFIASFVSAADRPEATSLLGKPLYAPALDEETGAEFEKNLAKAESEYAQNKNADNLIWLARRTAYLGRFQDAIEIFSNAIKQYPNDPGFYRHRGHRYLTVRKIDEAIADLEKGAQLIEGKADEIEPDGLPNAKNIPRSTTNTNIYYHLGLAYYLKGDFERAEQAFRECLKFAKNDDMLVATTHWLYMTLRRAGKEKGAEEVLQPIRETMDIIEDADYHALLLMYKGTKTPESLLQHNSNDLSNVTVGYGVGNWYLYNGKKDKALEIFERVLQSPQWPAFGYLAAEAEMKRKDK